jgi:hypothetical protein
LARQAIVGISGGISGGIDGSGTVDKNSQHKEVLVS